MEEKNNLVWYACYGSNLKKERFLCYIKGGRQRGCKKYFKGCTDKSLPIASEKFIIPYQLYFAKESKAWNGGVAFIKSKLNINDKKFAFGRVYLIKKQQFVQILRQENGKEIGNTSIKLDFDILEKKNYFILENQNLWYGKIINLGKRNRISVLTFTSKYDFKDYNLPSKSYLKTIIEGIKETYKIKNEKIVDYLVSIPGIYGKIERKEIEKLVKKKSQEEALLK